MFVEYLRCDVVIIYTYYVSGEMSPEYLGCNAVIVFQR